MPATDSRSLVENDSYRLSGAIALTSRFGLLRSFGKGGPSKTVRHSPASIRGRQARYLCHVFGWSAIKMSKASLRTLSGSPSSQNHVSEPLKRLPVQLFKLLKHPK